jgi:hypothetical protein
VTPSSTPTYRWVLVGGRAKMRKRESHEITRDGNDLSPRRVAEDWMLCRMPRAQLRVQSWRGFVMGDGEGNLLQHRRTSLVIVNVPVRVILHILRYSNVFICCSRPYFDFRQGILGFRVSFIIIMVRLF